MNCPKCKGKGIVRPVEPIRPGVAPIHYQQCPDCMGEGKIVKNDSEQQKEPEG
jgi:DnaJ-class molecular chaperone